MSATGLPILTYHALDTTGQVIATDPAWFVETIERLVNAGFIGVDLKDWTARGRPEVANGFAVAFDDGLRSILNGVEVLERYRVPASIFLVTDHVGGDNGWLGQPKRIHRSAMLDWSEVVDLSRRGFTIGAHTATHQRLDQLRPDRLKDELRASRDRIEGHIHQPCGLFAYPYGVSTSLLRNRVSLLFDAAFGTRLALSHAASSLFDLPRIDAFYLRSSQALNRLINGRLRQWLRLRSGLRLIRRLVRQ